MKSRETETADVGAFSALVGERCGLPGVLSPEQMKVLEAHYALMVRWNRVLNLTAVRDLESAVERHYCESLFLGSRLPSGTLRIVDVGSGAGFPGFPIAVLREDCSVTLVESHQRKAVFLREATRTVTNVRVLACRAEDVKEEFDWAVCRAVRAEEIAGPMLRLAPRIALLAGIEEPAIGIEGVVWDAPVPLPWGAVRCIWLGSRVSRETYE